MEKKVIDRRLKILQAEGIEFICNSEIGVDIKAETLEKKFDAIILATGATIKRELPVKGNHLKGVVQAMKFLPHNNKVIDNQYK